MAKMPDTIDFDVRVHGVPAGYVLVPLDPPESLRGQLCGYGADLSYMDTRDRAVILQRGAERWAEILRWAGAGGVQEGSNGAA